MATLGAYYSQWRSISHVLNFVADHGQLVISSQTIGNTQEERPVRPHRLRQPASTNAAPKNTATPQSTTKQGCQKYHNNLKIPAIESSFANIICKGSKFSTMLDPASATVAFVGFAASIAALIAVISDSAQTVHTLYCSLRDAPEELAYLKRIIEGNKALLKNIFIVSQRYETRGIPRDLFECWDKAAKHVFEDLQKFKIEIDKIFNTFNASSYSKRHLRGRVRQLFSAHAIDAEVSI